MTGTRRGEGQTALVTGASTGIGLALAECFAKDGYNVILAARSEGALKEIAGRLSRQNNIQATPIAVDLGVPGGGDKLAADIKSRGLSVDVLVNNAGFGIAGAFDAKDEEGQIGMIDLNNRSLVELTHQFWPDMLGKKRGGVLNVASTAAFQPGPYMAIYCATKAFVLSFSEALWVEGKKHGVTATCLCPGLTDSKFHERAGTGGLRLHTLGTAMTPQKVAEKGYRAFQQNKRVIVTGFDNRFLAKLVPFLPRRAVLSLASFILRPA
ncbi:MAG TPA: SDR family oxidoreductase [Rhizomicrobium sp.]|nr:SDR family oxidoreductase [Rhizomicrobium sp.]